MSRAILNGYAAAAAELAERFEAISSAEVFVPVRHLFPTSPARVADIGAGTGRDAAWFAGQGHAVVAVEPVAAFRRFGRARHASPRISWVDDTLPQLGRLIARGDTFDLIVLGAVWQHLRDAERRVALARLRALSGVGGRVVMSIRNGPGAPGRAVHAASAADAVSWAGEAGFCCIFEAASASVQEQNRLAGVTWTWLGFAAVDG
jgi:SAM-dependent methyltransferase